jgi:hypothetical protein
MREVEAVDPQDRFQFSGRGEFTKKLKVMFCALMFSTTVLFIGGSSNTRLPHLSPTEDAEFLVPFTA